MMNDHDLFFVVWLTDERHLAIYPAGTIVIDLQHSKSLTCCEQDLNLAEPKFRH